MRNADALQAYQVREFFKLNPVPQEAYPLIAITVCMCSFAGFHLYKNIHEDRSHVSLRRLKDLAGLTELAQVDAGSGSGSIRPQSLLEESHGGRGGLPLVVMKGWGEEIGRKRHR